ncbi:hypothetical protein [uncultured Paludibaculum sp.]|uniref:hypothetical protein n=1 Tax=uncultured Paludibaculum sp. TaxID=1765020 RepID=UPI002AAB1763|nr:hypothetical protein [uncultured Paludibaculum sp.]
MSEILYRNRRAVQLENEHVEIVVTREGGHLAVIRDKATGVNPLWSPPWPTIEPSTYNSVDDKVYGANAESRLLSGILGHNLCLDLFGGPSPEEAAAGLGVHGEGSVNEYDITVAGDTLTQRTILQLAHLSFQRTIQLPAGSRRATITETVENLDCCDRPIAWTQHVTLGPPFLERGLTQFRAAATKSQVIDASFSGAGYMKPGAEFTWPMVPTINGGVEDMQVFTDRKVSGAFSTHLMDPERETAYFSAWSPTSGIAIAYVWKQSDFPWLGIWEENHGRDVPPWNGQSLTRGMEFGASPFPESRRGMIHRGSLFGVPGYRWVSAKSAVTVTYQALVQPVASIDDLEL